MNNKDVMIISVVANIITPVQYWHDMIYGNYTSYHNQFDTDMLTFINAMLSRSLIFTDLFFFYFPTVCFLLSFVLISILTQADVFFPFLLMYFC